MNIEKIEINGHYVWVNKNAEIKDGDWIYDFTLKTIHQKPVKPYQKMYSHKKIIAASPELNLEGVPTYVE